MKSCIKCNKEFKPRTIGQKHCSHKCYWESKIGTKNSYGDKISKALKGRIKTKEHLNKIANALRVRTNRNCLVCNTSYYPSEDKQKTCSMECGWKIRTKKVETVCVTCNKTFHGINRKYCSVACFSKESSNARKGKNNPAYRNGTYMGSKKRNQSVHMNACKKYRKAFLAKHEYLFCEVCKTNANGTPRFEVHHIYFASLYPRHKELHNFQNLIMVCIQCHNNFHSSKYKDKFEELEKERGLKELFKA